MKQLLEKYLKIYVHESSRFIWIAGIFFVIFFVFAIFRNYVDTAFLKRFGPQYIPWMLVINALLTFVILGLSNRLAHRFRDHHLLAGLLVICAVSVAGLFFLVKADFTICYPILYQILYLLDALLLVYLWNIAGDIFDARQGKRLFPLVTACQVLGTTLGSFSTKPITLVIGEDPTLLIFGAVCLLAGIFLARTGVAMVGDVSPQKAATTAKRATKKLTEVPGLMSKFPIVRYLIITGLVPNILLPIFFYQFSVIANHTFASEQSLISFLSVFRGMTTLVTFVLLFFMGRLYSTMGLTNSSLVHPINFTVLFASLTAFFNIYVAAYGQFSVILIQRAIAGPVNKVLYSIIPDDLVAWSRTFIRGTVLKIGMLAGSLMMIGLKPVLEPRYFSIIAVLLGAWWVIETLAFRRHYKRILKQVIVEKEIDFDQIESVRAFDTGGGAVEIGHLSVEDRPDEAAAPDAVERPSMPVEVALKLLDDPNPNVRADAVGTFAVKQDLRAVSRLVRSLGEPNDRVRNAAIEALMSYRDSVVPYLEVSLAEAGPREKQGILEVIRLSGTKDFDMIPFLGAELTKAYDLLIVLRRLEALDSSPSVEMLKDYLQDTYDDTLRLIFYALWVHHADMRLMYHALQSETASIAVEMVENSIQREIVPYLIPLIESVPLDEKIQKGRRLLPLIRSDTLERLLTILVASKDAVTAMLSLYVIAEVKPDASFTPVIEARMNGEEPNVLALAKYALARTRNEEAPMPEVIEMINKLKRFSIFEGMGIRELHAIATVISHERYKRGDIIIREGEDNSSIYLVVAGEVMIYDKYGTPDEKEKVKLGDGAFMGELSMFTRLPPNATCIAASDLECFVLRHHQFLEIMRVYPQIGINLCGFFSLKCRTALY